MGTVYVVAAPAVRFPKPGVYNYTEALELFPDIYFIGTDPVEDTPPVWRPTAPSIPMTRYLLDMPLVRDLYPESIPKEAIADAFTFLWDGETLNVRVQLLREGVPVDTVTIALKPVTDWATNEIARRLVFKDPAWYRVSTRRQVLSALAAASPEACVAAWVRITQAHRGRPPAAPSAWIWQLQNYPQGPGSLGRGAPLDADALEVFAALGLDNWDGDLEELYEAAYALSRT